MIADASIYQKMDLDFVKGNLQREAIPENTYLVYVCKKKTKAKDDTWIKKGDTFFSIVLPYQEVLEMSTEEVQAVMLSKALERLKA
jgi:hypothetical protein